MTTPTTSFSLTAHLTSPDRMFARALTDVLRKSGINPAAHPMFRELLFRFSRS